MSNENETEKNENLNTEANESENNSKKTVYIVEGVIAAAAVIFIIVALVISGKNKNKPDPLAVSQDAISANSATTSTTTPDVDPLTGAPLEYVEIDNSALYENVPGMPAISEINIYDEAECEQLYEDEKMIKLDGPNGSYVYVPNFTDADYLKESVAYTDDEMQDFLYSTLLSNYTVDLQEERDVCQKYDSVTIDYAGYLDGVQFEGGTATDQPARLGAHTYIPGFEEGIIGMKVGETKDITVTFPENYGSTDLAGKEAVFTITLKSIDGVPAELTDELIAQSAFGISTADEYIEYAAMQLLSDKAYEFLTEKFYVSAIDEATTTNYYMTTMDYYDTVSQARQMSVEDMLTFSGSGTLDDFRNDVMLSSAESALSSALYQAVASYANLSVTDDDIIALRDSYGFTDTQALYDTYGEQTIRDYLLTDKVINYIISLSTDASVEE